jgi:hypothetical protein
MGQAAATVQSAVLAFPSTFHFVIDPSHKSCPGGSGSGCVTAATPSGDLALASRGEIIVGRIPSIMLDPIRSVEKLYSGYYSDV